MRVKLTDKTLRRSLPSPEERQVELWDTVLPGFGLRLGWKGTRSFIVQTRIDGKLRRFTVGRYPDKSLGEAREDARQILEDAQRGIDPKQRQAAERRENERRRRNTFRAVAEDFIEDHAKARGRRTWPEMQRYLERDVYPDWGDKPITDISRADVKELLRKKARTGPIAANRLLEIIRKLFNWALDEEIVEYSPATRVTPPAPETSRERILTPAELLLFWRAAGALAYPFGPFFRMLALTAQRKGEVAAMRWSQLDLEAGAWSLPGESAKEGQGHLVPLPALACAILAECPRVGDYVFMSGRSPNPISGFSKAKVRLDKAMTEANDGEAVARWRIHDLRRTAATRMRENGIDRLTVSKVLNHSEAGVTKVYDRFAMDPDKRRALDVWASYVERLQQPADSNVVGLR